MPEIASIIESNPGDLGGEKPLQRSQRQSVIEEGQFVGAPIVKVRRSFWNLLGWREWVVSVEWRVPRVPAVFTLEGDGAIEEVGWEVEDTGQSKGEKWEEIGGEGREEIGDGTMLDL